MNTDRLKAISLLDGRNFDKVGVVSDYFSEFALMRYRIRVETEYLTALSRKTGIVRKLTGKESEIIRSLWQMFSEEEALEIKRIEKKINHDVKAVEYFLREKFSRSTLGDISDFIHFGLTSYDVNIPAYALMLSDFRKEVLVPKIREIMERITELSSETADMVMLGRTHGQPALPTTMGKELAVYLERLRSELKIIETIPVEGKLTGAVGNFNALHFVAPEVNWIEFSREFISGLGLTPNIVTTQILPYDSWLRVFDSVKRVNNILYGFAQDIWWYISFEYFLQKKKEEEVGSSTMSHKINPITFENAEGNFGLANNMFEFFVRKLSYSRLQRDLSDSTIKRDFGLAFGFTLLAFDSILSGLSRIRPNPVKMEHDLDAHWEIFSEGIQTYLRLNREKNAYELLKEKTRGKTFTRKDIHQLIDELPLTESGKRKLKISTLKEYLGLAEKITNITLKKKI